MNDTTQKDRPSTTVGADSAERSDENYYFKDIPSTVGNTPLVKINKLNKEEGVDCLVLAKIEFINPTGSVKDRMAVWVLNDAVKKGELKPGGTIIEATSGNTGAAVGMYAATHGYKVILTIPDKMSQEKIDVLRAFGAEVKVYPVSAPADSPEHYYQAAKKIHESTPNSYFLEQYQNTKNIDAHYYTTGPEIWKQTRGKITCLVGGIGTGGTVSGIARFLKEQNPDIQIVAADPVGSIYYQFHKDGTVIEPDTYQVEGIGEDMVCESIDMKVIDKIYQVNDQECFDMALAMTRREGIFCGGSSGAAMCVALKHARTLSPDDVMVVILPDGGMKYVSKLYNDDWMREKGFLN
ncbi:MAG: cysteine synthase family protein [candidate division Zixibacteria bacterium]|nr:cysteine synthase family protein [candidate division Zixibacteria bacterium]